MFRISIDRLFLLFVFITPLLPRPTAEGPERFVLPLVLCGLIGAWLLFWPKEIRGNHPNFGLLVSILGFATLAFTFKVIVCSSTIELSMMLSRILFAVGTLVFVHWLCTTEVEPKQVFKVFMFGFVLTSCIAIFVGFTGIRILEEESVRPGRFFGIHKTTGIYRSFGEFGIMGSLAWGYLLFFRREFKISTWMVLSTIVLAGLIISQSRNVYLILFLTTLACLAMSTVQIPAFVRIAIVFGALLVPIAVEAGLPLMKQTPIVQQLVGRKQSLIGKNVDVRMEQFREVFLFISQDPIGTLGGFPRDDWRKFMINRHGIAIAPHNYFLSNLLFVGVVGGLVWIFGLFLIPAIRLSQQDHAHEPVKQLALVALWGTIVGLSFYEGFFSITVMIAIAVSWYLAFSNSENSESFSEENSALERKE